LAAITAQNNFLQDLTNYAQLLGQHISIVFVKIAIIKMCVIVPWKNTTLVKS
jgi:hypothetical protein